MSEVRLIDANALKERAKTMLKIIGEDNLSDYEQGKKYAFETAVDFIDNAPTVEQEVYITGTDYDFYIRGYKEGRRDFERPKGKWVKSKDGYFRCDQCGSRGSAIKARFCHHCGADMRGEKNDTKKD